MKNNKIPKIIHYCWFGKNKKSKLIKRCILSWKKMCPDYKIVEWNESNFDVNVNCYCKEAYDAKKWAFVSDYARLWIIYNYGGIYLDTDVELVKSLDDLLKYNSYFAAEDLVHINTGLGFGAKKNSDIVKKMLDDYNDIHFKLDELNYDMTPCPVRNTKSIEETYSKVLDKSSFCEVDNNVFLPKEYFCPYDATTGVMNKTKNTYGIHWYNASWRSKKTNLKRAILKPIKK